jgi:hypothetical protein
MGDIRVGTSSWTDPGFLEHWYPHGLSAAERLAYYAERFDCVELNAKRKIASLRLLLSASFLGHVAAV